jgi:hypothetical protein
MRNIFFLLGIVLLLTASASAQSNSTQPLLLTTPTLSLSSSLAPAPATPFSIAPGTSAIASNNSSAGAAAQSPQGVQGVFVNYNWQAYLGYTFFRFYEVPNIQENQNGFNFSMAYFLKDWLALDGEFAATRGTQSNFNSWFLFGGGGPRFRWSAPRNLEVWGHVLLGGSHFTPQTPFGTQEAFAFEAGGGVDINAHHHKIAYRVGADMVASHYFNTYQYSPKAFVGIVYKF